MDNKDIKETIKVQKTRLALLADTHYYNYVFKKTEKIACAVFYILHNHKDTNGQKEKYILDISDTAQRALNVVLKTLSREPHEAGLLLVQSVAYLVRLQSYLRLGHSIGVFSQDAVDVLDGEIEGVIRSIGRYLEETSGAFDLGISDEATTPASAFGGRESNRGSDRGSTARPAGHRAGTPRSASAGTTRAPRATQSHAARQQQIKDIIAAKGEVSIKDISEEIKDCSEKTIQREVNEMINKGIVKREGARRWSRYSLL